MENTKENIKENTKPQTANRPAIKRTSRVIKTAKKEEKISLTKPTKTATIVEVSANTIETDTSGAKNPNVITKPSGGAKPRLLASASILAVIKILLLIKNLLKNILFRPNLKILLKHL